MSVSATPQRPKPEERSVMPEGISATAASALSQSLEAPRSGAGAALAEGRLGAERRRWVVVKRRAEGKEVWGIVVLGDAVRLRTVVVNAAAVVVVRGWAWERREGMERRRCRDGVAMVD